MRHAADETMLDSVTEPWVGAAELSVSPLVLVVFVLSSDLHLVIYYRYIGSYINKNRGYIEYNIEYNYYNIKY